MKLAHGWCGILLVTLVSHIEYAVAASSYICPDSILIKCQANKPCTFIDGSSTQQIGAITWLIDYYHSQTTSQALQPTNFHFINSTVYANYPTNPATCIYWTSDLLPPQIAPLIVLVANSTLYPYLDAGYISHWYKSKYGISCGDQLHSDPSYCPLVLHLN